MYPMIHLDKILLDARDLAKSAHPPGLLNRAQRAIYRQGLRGYPCPLICSPEEKIAYLAGLLRAELDPTKVDPNWLGLELDTGCLLAF